MNQSKHDPTRPLWQLSVGEFEDLLSRHANQPTQVTSIEESSTVYLQGIAGLAAFLGCSRIRAQKLKSSGKIDAAVIQEGRTILIDKSLLVEILKQTNYVRRR